MTDLSVSAVSPVEKATTALIDALRSAIAEGNTVQEVASAAQNLAAPHEAPLVQPGFVERVLGEVQADATAAPPRPAGTRADSGLEHGLAQTQARPQPIAAERLHTHDNTLPASDAGSEFAVPPALLVPVTVIGLQAERAETWPLPQPAFVPMPLPLQGTSASSVQAPRVDVERDAQAQEDQRESEDDRAAADGECDTAEAELAPEVETEDWCDELSRTLREVLGAGVPPQPLQIAAGEWRRGRCVVLACPQGVDPAGPAWAFVLWPRTLGQSRPSAEERKTPPLLRGLRVEAYLQWSDLTPASHWLQVRMVKEHQPHSGRQLVPAGGLSGEPVACAVQLGPVLARLPRGWLVCVRINAAQRFWVALGSQWSVQVVVCSRALLPPRAPAAEEA